ncbi:FAD/NAD-P-binding domain-containing protein [Lenzites betulinus]|nr:FAD/NAD-P-binding domain-containing protein [Lenzites betulinus]
MSKLTVAIVGAGLCGLVFALALEKYAPDVDYQIYEAAAELTTAGAGIGLQPRTLFVLRELGLEEALLKISGTIDSQRVTLVYRKSDQRDAFTFNHSSLDEPQMTFHRAELQKLFLDHLRRPERIHLGKRFTSYTQHQGPNGQTEVHFKDGSTVQCDVLVGADGIKSGVRGAMYTKLADAATEAGHDEEAQKLRSCIRAVSAGQFVYRGLIEREPIAEGKPRPLNMSHLMIYGGKNHHLIAYPISQGRILNVAAVVHRPELVGTIYEGPWTAEAPREEVVQSFVGWDPEVEDIMQNMKSWSKWAVNMVNNLPTFVDGWVALLGDAAHSMTPHQGAGAGQGFEDCLMLGMLLGQPNVKKDNIPAVLKIYDHYRRPVAQMVAALSLQSGHLHSFMDPELSEVTPEMSAAGKGITKEYLDRISVVIEDLKAWRRGTTVMPDCQAALDRVRGLGGNSEPLKSSL